MRHLIKGMVAAFAVMTAGAAPAMACGYSPCASSYYAPTYTYEPAYTYAPAYTYNSTPAYSGCGGCNTATTGWGYERLAEPTTQYYYVNQGPTYNGPGCVRAGADLSGRRGADLLRLPSSLSSVRLSLWMASLRLRASLSLLPAPPSLRRWRGHLLGPPSGAPLLLISEAREPRLQRPLVSCERTLSFQAACVTASGNRRSWPA